MTNKKFYYKTALSIPKQIEKLKNRGMIISDEAKVNHFLKFTNYYRFSGYLLPYESNHQSHQLIQGTSIERVQNDYDFDRELRLLVIDIVEKIEVAVRCQMAYHLGIKYGSHVHLFENYFRNPTFYKKQIKQLETVFSGSKETFSKHFRSKYLESLPPIWAVVEIMTLGQLSHFFSMLRHRADRNAIANVFDFDESVFSSFLHHLSYVRNICAHHSRLWNRDLVITLKLPKKKPATIAISVNKLSPVKLYNTLVVLNYFSKLISQDNLWQERLLKCINDYQINQSSMGFPDDWQMLEIWN